MSICLLICFLSFTALAQNDKSKVWKVALPAGSTASSRIEVKNTCRSEHEYRLKHNVAFVTAAAETLKVAGGQTSAFAITFNTKALTTGKYNGEIGVACLTCTREASCSPNDFQRKFVLIVTAPLKNTSSVSMPGFDPKPVKVSQKAISRIPNVTAALNEFLKGPCPEKERDCEKLRLTAAELEQAAGEAEAKAATSAEPDIAKKEAANLRKSADEALEKYTNCLRTTREDCEKLRNQKKPGE